MSKKLLSLILAIVMIAAVFVPYAGAANCNATYSTTPIIYVQGNKNTKIYDKDGNQIWPLTTSVGTAISNNQSNIVKKAILSYTTSNWNYLSNELYDTLYPLFKDLMLDKNGNISNGSHISDEVNQVTKDSDGKYTAYEYKFRYDPRLDPTEIAVSLRSYVNKICSVNGCSKVNIVARCMGTSVLSAYLTKYKSDSKVRTAVYYAAGCNGVLIEESPFSGQMSFTASSLKAFANSSGNESLGEVISSLCDIFGSKAVTKYGGEIINDAMPEILPRLLRLTYGNFPSYWSLIDNNYYTDCKNYVFNTSSLKTQYSGLIKKIDTYHNNVFNLQESTLTYLKQVKGVNINVITKYNVAFSSIYEGSEAQGDSWIEAEKQSFGANFPDYGSKLSASYCEGLYEAGLGNYIAGDRTVDASTCLFPDYTFFIKGISHDNWTTTIDKLIYAIFSTTKQVTTKTYSNFPQFMKYSNDKLYTLYNYNQTKRPEYASASLSCSNYTYNGSNKTPSVTVKGTDGSTLVRNTDYTLTYETYRASIGIHYVKIKFIGQFAGQDSVKLSYRIRPGDVTDLKVKSSTTNSVTLSWSNPVGATAYRVYKYNSTKKSWSVVGNTKSTTYTIKNLTPGSSIKYSVRAYKTVNGTPIYSNDFVAVNVYLTPSAPTSVKAVAGTKQITVKWAKTTGATSYQVFRSTSKSGIYTRIATVTTNSYVNSSLLTGRTYYYKVRAIKTANNKNYTSAFSSIVSAKVK